MHDDFTIEDIEALRLGVGIEDVRLASAIRSLGAGDQVRLTFLPGVGVLPNVGARPETLVVRITSRKGLRFRGKLAGRPRSSRLKKLRAGAALTFTAAQIHSILNPSRNPESPKRTGA
jgi:hypothetical protein